MKGRLRQTALHFRSVCLFVEKEDLIVACLKQKKPTNAGFLQELKIGIKVLLNSGGLLLPS